MFQPHIEKLKRNVDFNRVYKKGKSLVNKYMVLIFIKNSENCTRVGFIASKKVGKSVVRNRARRLMRESFRRNSHKVKAGYDIIFIARASIKNVGYWDVEKSMMRLFKKSGIIE